MTTQKTPKAPVKKKSATKKSTLISTSKKKSAAKKKTPATSKKKEPASSSTKKGKKSAAKKKAPSTAVTKTTESAAKSKTKKKATGTKRPGPAASTKKAKKTATKKTAESAANMTKIKKATEKERDQNITKEVILSEIAISERNSPPPPPPRQRAQKSETQTTPMPLTESPVKTPVETTLGASAILNRTKTSSVEQTSNVVAKNPVGISDTADGRTRTIKTTTLLTLLKQIRFTKPTWIQKFSKRLKWGIPVLLGVAALLFFALPSDDSQPSVDSLLSDESLPLATNSNSESSAVNENAPECDRVIKHTIELLPNAAKTVALRENRGLIAQCERTSSGHRSCVLAANSPLDLAPCAQL